MSTVDTAARAGQLTAEQVQAGEALPELRIPITATAPIKNSRPRPARPAGAGPATSWSPSLPRPRATRSASRNSPPLTRVVWIR